LTPLAQTEKAGADFAQSSLGAASIEVLRAKPADEVLQAASKAGAFRFTPNIDGYFLPMDASAIYAAGQQSRVPLLAGWNADEGNYRAILRKDEPTAQNFIARVRTLFGANAEALLKLYPATTDAEAKRAAQDLAGDQFIAFSTWKWMEMHQRTAKSMIFRYRFDQTLPLPESASSNPPAEPTAPHAGEIEFVFAMLSSKKLPWRPEDRKLSDLMGSYWTNFARTGDPNGPGLPRWPAYSAQDGYQVMHLRVDPRPAQDNHRARYEFLDSLAVGK
jgi:para-nitrobenzyl esterase